MDEANSATAREVAVTENPKAIIVGGGIGGLTAGIALRQAGINAVVILDTFAEMVTFSIDERMLDDLEVVFRSHLE